LLSGLCLWLAVPGAAHAAPAPPLSIEAVQAEGWQGEVPPAEGWTPVVLPDTWAQRWPGFDGVVWYRLQWEQPADAPEAGVLMEYLIMAGAVWLNGTPISRDASLVEPLTRAWNTPRYWLLAAPVLRPGAANTLLVRVSGLAAYQAGLGPVTVGPPAAIWPQYEQQRSVRRDQQIFGLAISTVVAVFFGVLWALRRRETAYGWFALMSCLWLLFAINQVVTTPWPFATTDGWQAFSTSSLMAFCCSFLIFALRFCERRLPRFEVGLALVALACWLDLWLAAPAAMGLHRSLWTVAAIVVYTVASGGYLVYAGLVRTRRIFALSPFMLAGFLASAHDMLVFLQIIDSNVYYSAMVSYVTVFGMALVMAGRFVQSLQRIENFNTELTDEVEAARTELANTLAQRHALELTHARIGERVNLASDLHDGLGGMLVGNIATLEQAPHSQSAPQLLVMLKSLRDDLRLIIDATGRDDGQRSFGELLAPLRHRMTQLLDANGIDCRWQVAGLDGLELPPSQSLELLRFLQEALTNVLKHSGAKCVDVSLLRSGDALSLAVQDNGSGFVQKAAEQASGAGLRSMRARAHRLGSALQLESTPGATRVALQIHLPGA
jgi:signal transduction histidine kinase